MRRWNEKDHPRNPDDGRFRDKVGGVGWARRISDAIGRRRRGEAQPTYSGPDLAEARRRYGLSADASNEDLGQAIRRAATEHYERDREGVYRPPGDRLDEELADLTRRQESEERNASKRQIISTYVDDLFELAEDVQNGVFVHHGEIADMTGAREAIVEPDAELEDLINRLADVVVDRPDNWTALQHASENLRRYLVRSGLTNLGRLPQRPPESTWRRD